MRAALGAGRGALRRTLLAESLVLCAAGAGLGLLLAAAARERGGPLCRALFRSRARSHGGRQRALARRRAGSRGGRAARLHSPAPVVRSLRRLGAVRRQRADHARDEPPSADLCDDSDRVHLRAACGRRHAGRHLDGVANREHRLRPATRPGDRPSGETRTRLTRPREGELSSRKPRGGSASCQAWRVSRSEGACPGATAAPHGCSLSPTGTSPRTAKKARRAGCATFPLSTSQYSASRFSRAGTLPTTTVPARSSWPLSTRAWRSGCSRTVTRSTVVSRPPIWEPILEVQQPSRIVGIVADVDEDNVVQEPSMIVYYPASRRRRPSIRACRRRSARAHPVRDAHDPRGLRRSGGRAAGRARGHSR